MRRLLRRPRASMRFWLLALLLPGIVALLVYDSRSDYRAMSEITREAYDSALLEPAKVLETSVEFNPDGSLRIDPPFYAQVMLESRANSRKYFRVEEVVPTRGSLAGLPGREIQARKLIGMDGLPKPEHLADHEGVPLFYNTMFRNDELRMVAIWRDLYFKGTHRQIIVLVGESIDMRLRTLQAAWRQSLFRDIRMVLLVVLLVWLSVEWALRPLSDLRREFSIRDVDDLEPLDPSDVPREVVPLVNSVNHHIELYRRVLNRQARFLADASHQLRTPLAIMRTQAQYARREPDPERMRETLDAIIRQLGRTTRLTEQLLALAHVSRHDTAPHTYVDLNALARDVVLQYLPLARERNQDLGWAAPEASSVSAGGLPTAPFVRGNDAELHEAIANLVHNAINHAGDGCTITVSTGVTNDRAWVSVCDNGVGLDPMLRDSVFIRFDRGVAERKRLRGGGSGLGLAIALAYAERNHGTITLEDGEPNATGGVGLCAVLRLPRAKPPATRSDVNA